MASTCGGGVQHFGWNGDLVQMLIRHPNKAYYHLPKSMSDVLVLLPTILCRIFLVTHRFTSFILVFRLQMAPLVPMLLSLVFPLIKFLEFLILSF